MTAVKLNACHTNLVAIVDRPNDAKSVLHAGYGKVIVVPEEQKIQPFVQGTHSVLDYFNSLPDENLFKEPNKIAITGSLTLLLPDGDPPPIA